MRHKPVLPPRFGKAGLFIGGVCRFERTPVENQGFTARLKEKVAI